MALFIYTDGAALGNPGPMGIGIVVYRNGKKMKGISEYVGQGTNNMAEYTAVIRALEYAKKIGEKDVHLRSDSQLIVRQLSGEYKTRDPKLRTLKRKIDELRKGMDIVFEHIPREKNEEADALSKEAAEKGRGERKKQVQQKLS